MKLSIALSALMLASATAFAPAAFVPKGAINVQQQSALKMA
jgi:hypothetical protein